MVEEMPDHRASAAGIVDGDDRSLPVAGDGVYEHQRESRRDVAGEGLGGDVGGHEEETIDASLHRPERRLHLDGIVVRAGEEEVVSGVPDAAINAANDLREELAVEVGEEDSQRIG